MVMKELWQKNKRLLTVGMILVIIVLIWGGLLISHSIEKSNEVIHTNDLMEQSTGSIRVYDVEGLTQEEVNEYIETIHNTNKRED